MRRGRQHRGDWLLLGGLVLAGCLLGLFLLLTGREGAQVQIRVAGTVVETFSLSRDRTYTIQGAGGGTNLLVIQDGEAWIEEASCPDGLCVHMGRIHRDGQSVVCLPNQVVVEVVAGDGDADTDAAVDLVAG